MRLLRGNYRKPGERAWAARRGSRGETVHHGCDREFARARPRSWPRESDVQNHRLTLPGSEPGGRLSCGVMSKRKRASTGKTPAGADSTPAGDEAAASADDASVKEDMAHVSPDMLAGSPDIFASKPSAQAPQHDT